MRLYYFGIYDSYGGLENFAHNLILRIRRMGVDVTILSPCEHISFEKDFLDVGCQIVRLPDFRKNPILYAKTFDRAVKNASSEDVVQLNICSYRNAIPFLICKKRKLRTVIVGHYTSIADKKFPWLHYLNRRLFRNLGVKVTNSEDVTRFMFCKGTHPVSIFNGIDIKRFEFNEASRKEIRNSHVFLNGITIGQIGRVTRDKNPVFSLMVIEKLHSIDSRFSLRLIGDEKESEARKYAVEHKLMDFVFFDGGQHGGVEKWYSALDILLLPSPKEGLSLTLLESSCNGICLFASTAVPMLNCHRGVSHYLDLQVDLWVASILKYSQESSLDRQDYIKGSNYDLDVSASSYLDLYLNYSKYKGSK